MTTQINQLTELTSTSDGDLLLIREASTGVDKKMQAVNLRAKATTKDDVGLGNVDNVSAASLRDRSTHTGTQPLSTISDAGTIASQNANSVNIDGGNIDGTAIGLASASSGAFTTLTASGDVNFDSGTLFVDASTNAVGIGITSGIDSATSLQIVQNSSGPVYPLIVGNANVGVGNAARLFFAPSNNVLGPYIEGYAEEDFSVPANRTGGLTFGTRLNGAASTERMRIDSSGRVGIGTTSPSSKLHVNGSTTVQNSTFRVYNNALTAGLIVYPPGISGAWSESTGFALASEGSSSPIGFVQGVTERMRIDSSGNVGIGTTSPGELLDVNGPIRRRLKSFSDFNTAYGPGSDSIFEGYSNFQPSNRPSGANYFHVKSMKIPVGGGGIYINQIAYGVNGSIHTRFSSNNGSTWSAWVEK